MADPIAGIVERARDRLAQAKQLLAQGQTGPDTQAAQTDTLEAIDRLIEAAQRQEAAERQAGGAGASGRTQAPKPAASPEQTADPSPKPNDDNSPNMSSQPPSGMPGAWGKLPAKEREKLLRTLGEQGFPPRYRAQLEAYYRGLRTPPSSPTNNKPVSSRETPNRVEAQDFTRGQR
ncbi:MAG: hypothetical protein U1A77_14840 [Pirellulales bacterium]